MTQTSNPGPLHVAPSSDPADPREAAACAPQAQPPSRAPGAPPTNRAPGNCTVLRYGVDSLYLSYRGRLRDEWIKVLEDGRNNALSPSEIIQASAQVSLLDHRFEVGGGGSKLYRYRLTDGAYTIQLSRHKASDVPVAYVGIRSHWLTSLGVEQAVAQLGLILRAMASLTDEPNVSRMDLFVDFMASVALDELDLKAFITRARDKAHYSTDDKATGVVVGQGGMLSARLYDKTLEVRKSKKDYLFSLWEAAGWTPERKVYRLEFQFRNEALKELGLRSYSALLASAGGLWRYATTDWLRLSVPNPGDETKARWPTHPLWAELSEHPWGAVDAAERVPMQSGRAPSLASTLKLYEAAITSYMAVHSIIDPMVAAERLMADMLQQSYRYMEATGETVEARLVARAKRKAKDFNQPFPGESIIDAEAVREAARLAYLRATGRE